MSNKYKHGDIVPTSVLIARLEELSNAVTKGRDAINREFTMRIPAELDCDADLVISQAAQRLRETDQALEEWQIEHWAKVHDISVTETDLHSMIDDARSLHKLVLGSVT